MRAFAVVLVGLGVVGACNSGSPHCGAEYLTDFGKVVLVPSKTGTGLVPPDTARGDGGQILDCSSVLTEITLPHSECVNLCSSSMWCPGAGEVDRCTVTPLCSVVTSASQPLTRSQAQYVRCDWD